MYSGEGLDHWVSIKKRKKLEEKYYYIYTAVDTFL